jgi:hypothetical protein
VKDHWVQAAQQLARELQRHLDDPQEEVLEQLKLDPQPVLLV